MGNTLEAEKNFKVIRTRIHEYKQLDIRYQFQLFVSIKNTLRKY